MRVIKVKVQIECPVTRKVIWVEVADLDTVEDGGWTMNSVTAIVKCPSCKGLHEVKLA